MTTGDAVPLLFGEFKVASVAKGRKLLEMAECAFAKEDNGAGDENHAYDENLDRFASPNLVREAERTAKEEDRTRSELACEALRIYIEERRWRNSRHSGSAITLTSFYNPQGRKVGTVSHLRNTEYLYVVSRDSRQ